MATDDIPEMDLPMLLEQAAALLRAAELKAPGSPRDGSTLAGSIHVTRLVCERDLYDAKIKSENPK